MKIEGDVQYAAQQGQELQGEFLRSSMHANEAQSTLAKIDAAKKSVLDGLAGQEVYGNESRVDAATQEMARLSAEAAKLKAAAEGGMTNEQYVARIDSLTKKYVGRYPGLGDKIRETIGHATGMPGADLWAQQQYVRDRFAKPEAKDNVMSHEKMLLKDIEMIVKETGGSFEELQKLYAENRPEYDRQLQKAKKVAGVRSAEATLKAELATATAHADNDADTTKASFANIVNLGITSSILSAHTAGQEQAYASYLDGVRQGKDIATLPEGTALLEQHRTQMQTHISNIRILARGEIQKYLNANPKISPAKAEELFKGVETQLAEFDKKYAGKEGLFALATSLNTFRDKKLSEQMQIADMNIKLQGAMQNQPLVSMYMQGGDSRERVKREQPHFFQFMQGLDIERKGVTGAISDLVSAGGGIAVLQMGVKTGEAGGVVHTPPGSDPKPTHAAREVVFDKARQALAASANSGELSVQAAMCIKSAIATNIEKGSCAPLFRSKSAVMTKQFETLPPDVQDTVRAAASNSSVVNMEKLQKIQKRVETQFGVSLQFGVNDAGEIAPFYPPAPPPPKQTGTMASKTSIPPIQQMSDERRAYKDAMDAFFKDALPLTSNLVYGRSVVMGQPTKEIAKQYAEYLNTKTLPFTGFYSSNATSAAGTDGDGGSEPSKKPVISDWSQPR
jgi:hypothetical protein